jgi:hypothetical protein
MNFVTKYSEIEGGKWYASIDNTNVDFDPVSFASLLERI